jgi:hypothetical protein
VFNRHHLRRQGSRENDNVPTDFSAVIGSRPHDTSSVLRAKLIPKLMNTPRKIDISSSRSTGKRLTLGDLIIATYSACGEQRAPLIVQLAIDSHLVRFEQGIGTAIRKMVQDHAVKLVR